MTREYQKLFVRMMTPLFQAQQSVVDLFFKNRLNEDIEHLINGHIQYWTCLSEESRRDFIRTLKDLNKILQEIIYLEKGDIIQLSITQEQVLRYLLSFIQGIQIKKEISNKVEVVTEPTEPTPLITASSPVVWKTKQGKGKLTKTQEQILEFVRKEPDCRTKDVMNQFSVLSQRTVKRGLKELNEEGKIAKRIERGAVYYSAK
ncbi:MAG: DeoR family transcriptional regulator [bacterium]|nr:DeoR family transcriptional regulator [bacterium]